MVMNSLPCRLFFIVQGRRERTHAGLPVPVRARRLARRLGSCGMTGETSGQAYWMAPEWARHERTWMAWPCNAFVLGEDAQGAFQAWAQAANTIARFEPVTMLVPPGQMRDARRFLDDGVTCVEVPLGDSWLRDSGPTFVFGPTMRCAPSTGPSTAGAGAPFPRRARMRWWRVRWRGWRMRAGCPRASSTRAAASMSTARERFS